MNKTKMNITAVLVALVFLGVVIIYPLAFSPDQGSGAPEANFEVK